MSKRPRQPNKSTTPAAKPAKAKPAKPAEPGPTKTSAPTKPPAKPSAPAKPPVKTAATKPDDPTPPPLRGVSARAVQQAARAAEPPVEPTKRVGPVRKAVKAVLTLAGKLGEEVLERVTGEAEAEPTPISAYLSPTAAAAGESVPEDRSRTSAGPEPVPEDTPGAASEPVPEDMPDASVYVASVPAPEPTPELGVYLSPVPEDSSEDSARDIVEVAQVVGIVDPAAAPDPALYIDPDALAGRVVPVPAAYLAEVPHTPNPVVYLADLPEPADPIPAAAPAAPTPGLGADDLHYFAEGTHLRLFEKLGAQVQAGGGVHFAVWAPNARHVSVIGEWNGWDPERDVLQRGPSGVWQGLVAAAAAGMLYKYRVVGMRGEVMDRADPCGLATELPPQTASRIAVLEHRWRDDAWLAKRAERQSARAPISAYELHLGSWMRGPQGEWLSYRDIAPRLVEHMRALGFTHVEFMPLTEHPFYGSWGYQTSGYFAPSARFGGPQDLMFLIDELHRADIGVILDWVPGHFPADAHALARFDGTCLYEHHDPRRGVHPDWNTLIFNLGRNEVRSFLLSSAMLWIERYHVDAIRVDAVASMLYLDYSRKDGQWLPNEHGGRENLETVAFLRALNTEIHARHPGVLTIAEESTAWPLVTGPVARGGLGFDRKWDMGWMHDTLRYLGRDPILRQHHHQELTFRMWYAYSERYMLPLSHDEVVHGKGSLIRKMHGDARHKFAGLRLLLAYMFTTPGNKLLFMGSEFAQIREWDHERQLDWDLRAQPQHAGLERWVARIARLYRDTPALHELDLDPAGFEWLIVDDRMRSLAVYLRLPSRGPALLVALNFTPVAWVDHRVGVPAEGTWTLVDRSDAAEYSGEPEQDEPGARPDHYIAAPEPAQDRPFSLTLTLPPLSAVLLAGPDAAELRAAGERHRAERIAREAAAVAVAEAATALAIAEAEAAAKAEAEAAAKAAAEAEAIAAAQAEARAVASAAAAAMAEARAVAEAMAAAQAAEAQARVDAAQAEARAVANAVTPADAVDARVHAVTNAGEDVAPTQPVAAPQAVESQRPRGPSRNER